MEKTITDFIESLGINEIFSKIIGGILILIIGFIVAKLVASLFGKIFNKIGLDSKIKSDFSLSRFVKKLVYYLLMIVVLMMALNVFGVGEEVLAPLNAMVSKFALALPNIITAGIIIYAGYFLSKMISELIYVSGSTIQKWNSKLQVSENFDFLSLIKTIVKIVIFIPVLIIGLDFLNFDVVTEPATSMLDQFLSTIPLILKAIALLVVFYFGGKVVTNLLKDLLLNLGVDKFSHKLSLDKIVTGSLSSLIANLAFILVIYLAVMQALDILYLEKISIVMANVLEIGGKIALGLFILTLGNLVANFVVKIFEGNNSINKFSLGVIKFAIIFIFLAMGLSAMDIADDIINLAFGLGMGAIAVAFALAFGLGGREAAGKELQNFFDKFKDNTTDSTKDIK